MNIRFEDKSISVHYIDIELLVIDERDLHQDYKYYNQ